MNEVYAERAKQLGDAREYLHEEQAFASATALLSVHTAIALNDALLQRMTGKPFRSEDHGAAVRELQKRCRERGFDTKGVEQFRKLISAKSQVAYGDKLTTFDAALVLYVACSRFQVWVYQRLAELA